MRGSDSGYAHGTLGSPQTTMEQEEYAAKVAENEAALEAFAASLELVDPEHIAEMEASGVKFNKDEVMLTARDATGQVVWLEKGNVLVGYTHIQIRNHIGQLAKKFNVPESEVLQLIRSVIDDGKLASNIVKQRGGRDVVERIYEYNDGNLMLVALGTNGFVVSAYPTDK